VASSNVDHYKRALTALTYATLDGCVLDLSGLTADERAYLAHCYAAYRSGMRWSDFGELAHGSQHPLLRATGGQVTLAIWEHPLYQATSDLEDRLGIQQDELAPDPGDDVGRDPIADERIRTIAATDEQALTVPR